jgi:hypothetical protein
MRATTEKERGEGEAYAAGGDVGHEGFAGCLGGDGRYGEGEDSEDLHF